MPRIRVTRKVTRRVTSKVTVKRQLRWKVKSRSQIIQRPPLRSMPSSTPARQITTQRTVHRTPLSSVSSLVRDVDDGLVPDADTGEIYDVFICHASEDKDNFVRPLAHALRDAGLSVWFDEFELRMGDSLRRSIDRGVRSSRTGLVVFSHQFFGKGWTNYELDGIVTKNVSGEQQLLPIWHGVTDDDVRAYSPSLADKVARSTQKYTIDEIVAEIVDLLDSA